MMNGLPYDCHDEHRWVRESRRVTRIGDVKLSKSYYIDPDFSLEFAILIANQATAESDWADSVINIKMKYRKRGALAPSYALQREP